jgi:hypothetical protein
MTGTDWCGPTSTILPLMVDLMLSRNVVRSVAFGRVGNVICTA